MSINLGKWIGDYHLVWFSTGTFCPDGWGLLLSRMPLQPAAIILRGRR
jgi:hypothetical protein